jgi:hypothetical protein
MEITYRVVVVDDDNWAGKTASSAELAKLAAGKLPRERRLGLERTEWVEHFDKLKAQRTVLVEAESKPGEWELGG